MRTEAMVMDRSVKLLFAKGLLNFKGVTEWLAEDNHYQQTVIYRNRLNASVLTYSNIPSSISAYKCLMSLSSVQG